MTTSRNEVGLAHDCRWPLKALGCVAESTDYVANGSFASLKTNVTYRSEPDYAVLVRFTDFAKGWKRRFVYVDESSFRFLKKSALSPGDVVVSNVGEPGRVFRVPDLGRPMTLGPNAVLIRPSEDLDRGFLAYFLSSPRGQALFAAITTGTAQRKFNKTALRKLEVPVPALDEQQRIVAEIEKQLTRLEAGVTALRHAQASLKRYRAAVLKAACEGRLVPTEAELAISENRKFECGEELLARILMERRKNWQGRGKYREPGAPDTTSLDRLPAGWVWASPAQLSSAEAYALAIGPFGSNLKVSDYSDAGIPLVFVRNIRSSQFGGERTIFVSKNKGAELRAHQVTRGDVLVTKMGEPPGDACLYPESEPDAVITADCIKLRLTPTLGQRRFFVHAINSELIKPQIRQITKGVAQMKVSLGRFSTLAIPLPPLAEQARIVAEVERRLSVVDELGAVVSINLQRATRLRQAVFARAFAG